MTTIAPQPKVYELCDQADTAIYTPGRPAQPILLVCHNTAGPYDKNNVGTEEAKILHNNTVAWFLNNPAPVSAHWYIGPEIIGAPLYHFVHEYDTAYHVGGNPPANPANFYDPDTGTHYTGYALNQVAIGVEVFGQPYEKIGPAQLATIKYLLTAYQGGIFNRHPVIKDPLRIIDHKRLEPGDRTDGTNWVNIARQIAMVS